MTAELLCLLSLGLTFFLARQSLGAGLVGLLTVGYAYGILRANLPAEASHFIFDAAVVGMYAGVFSNPTSQAARYRSISLQPWVAALVAWPVLLLFVPTQDWLIQLVGLRGAIFFLPFLLIGARLEEDDLVTFVKGMAVLNIAELGMALTEYFLGIEQFFPHNAVTELIYRSNDVTAAGAYRIPATFTSSAAYGGMMAFSVPFLAGVWAQMPGFGRKRLLEAGFVAAGLGVFLCASRTQAILLFVLVIGIFTGIRLKTSHKVGLVAFILLVAWVVSKDERLQRFMTLSDAEYVTARIGGSVNSSFIDALLKYPMGNGLGGGGTSIPYFLAERLRNPVGIENEYGRILLDQGVLGLLLWIVFVLWLLVSARPGRGRRWYLARLLCWIVVAFSFIGAVMGTGTLTAIPQTAMLLLASGWLIARHREHTALVTQVLPQRAGTAPELAFEPAMRR